MVCQLVVIDFVMIGHALGVHWKVSAAVITGFLGSTIVEVIGIVLVVTRYLFPIRGEDPTS